MRKEKINILDLEQRVHNAAIARTSEYFHDAFQEFYYHNIHLGYELQYH